MIAAKNCDKFCAAGRCVELATGLRLLHEAQRQFEIQGDQDSLVLALENEAGYFEVSKKKKEAAQLRQRIQGLVRGEEGQRVVN